MSTYCISVKDIEVTNAIKHIEKSLQSNSYLREKLAGREIDRSTISHLIQSVLLSDANKNDNLKSTELNRLVYEGFSKLLINNMYFKKDSIRNGHLLPNTVQYGLNELLQGVNSSRIHVTITDIKQATPIIHSVDGTTIDNSYSFSDFKRDVQGFPTLKSVFELMLGSSDLFGDNINNAFKSEEHFKLFLATVANALVQNSPNSIKLFSENITDDYFKNPSVQNNIKSLYKQATTLYENTSYSARLYDSKEKPIREYTSMVTNISTIAKSKWSNIVKNTHYHHGLMGFKVSATLMENPDKFDRQFDLMAHFMGFNLKRREANNAGLFGFYPYGVDLNLSELDILAGLENIIRSTVPTNRKLNSFSHNIDQMNTMEYIVNVLLNKADQKRDIASIKYFVENSNDDLQELKIVADAALRFFENEYGVTLHSLQADIANGSLQDLSTLFQSIHNELKERYNFPYRSNDVYNFEVTPNSEIQKLIDAAPETNVETLITGLQLGNELNLDNDGVSVGSLINFVLRRYSNRKNELIPQLITRLMENNPDLAKVKVKLADLDNKFGTANLKTDTITLNRIIPTVDRLNISFEEVFFHELMHMATMKNMSPRLYKETSKYLSEVHRAIKNELYKKYNATLSKDQAISKAQEEFDKMLDNVEYQGLKNPEEFFAELFRSPNLMRVLNKLDATGTVEVKENFFTKLLNLIAELFNFNKNKNSISKVTAFEEGKQLLSDALFLNSKKIIDLQTGITENKTKLTRSIELRKKEQIYKAAINRSTGDFLVELFNKLLETYPPGSEFYGVVSDMITREVSNPRGYSNLRQFIATSALYNSQFINNDINDNISPEGVLSVAYKQAFEKWVMTPANLKKMVNYPVSTINSHLRTKDYALYIVDGNLKNLPMVYHKADTYVLYQVSQNHHRLIPIGEHDSQKGMFVKIEDGVISRGRVDLNNQPYFTELIGYVAPALYRKVPQSKHEKLMNDYNRDIVKIMDRSNMLLGMARNQINEWEKESPEKSREEVINSHPYMDIYKSLVDKLNEYKEFTDESDPAFIEYSLVLDNLDALIDTIIYDLRITEGIVLKDISLNTEQTNLSEAQDRTMITKSMIKNKEAIQSLSEEEKAALFEEDLEDDDENSQKETYMLRADTKSIFDRTSMKVKRALYNVTYPALSDQYMDDLGHERRVPLMELKDAIITVLRPLETPSEMIQLLRENTDRFPYFESLINMLESDPLLFTGFYNAFKTFYVEGAIITNNSNPFFSLSRNSIKSKITDGWIVNMIDGIVLNDLSIYSTNININKEALRKKIDELMNYIDEFNKTVIELSEATPEIKRNAYAPLLYRLENMLGAVGIDVNYHELDLMFSRSYNKENKTLVIQSFSKLTNRLKLDLKTLKERDLDKIALTNDLVDSFKGTINEVFKKYVNSIPIDGEAFVVQGGKGYYLNRPVSYISSIVKGINNFSGDPQKLDQFFSEKFHYPGLYSRISPLSAAGKFKHYSNFLNDLYNDPSYRKAFGYSTAISIFGEEWKKLGIDSHALGRVYAYMSEYNTDYGYFQLPTLSDSPELGFLKMKRYKGEDGMNEIANNLANLIQTEINRIQLVNRRSKMDDTIKITNFDILDGETSSNGSKFVNFAFLESPSNSKLKSQLLSSEYTDEQKHELLLPAINQYMNELVEDFKETYPEIVGAIEMKYDKHGIDALLTEYMYNDYNATAEILHMLGIDMAFYKNPVDFQKRFKQVYASGIPLNTEAEIPTFEFNASTGVFTPKPGFERVGKTHRNVMVLADFMQYSTISDAMIDSLEKLFPDISKRSEIAKKLGVYNEVKEIADKKDSTKNIKKYYYNTKNHLGEDISFEISPMNITDGQSFLSLDEIRTVNAMADRHSPEMERAYVAYKQTGDDRYLSEMLSSIKSFYYSDLRTPSGDTLIPDIKNNIQIKHSESVLLKYALVKSSPILNAISEFLNDPQNLGDPNGINKIDSVSFESTQKVGLTYKVNINNMTGDEIKAKLYEAAKNGEYITLDYNNYVIQQPTKNHITENYDLLVGSQLRRILIGDIPNDTTFNIGNEVLTKQEYIDVLNGIINEQIKRSFNELKDELQDPVKLSVLLKRAVISNNRYHRKLLDAFELDNHGQFKIPLFSPQNSILVQEMIMSIIKNTIVKRKIHGGKVVNTSNIGYADSLHIQFDSNNNPQYFEAYMPWFGTKEEYGAIHDEKGNLLLDKIDDKLLNTIFYRVPTEDNYSIIPIRIKGFLPPSQGVSIILPSEISSLTGLDFDIDSMYGFIYNYYTTKDKNGNIKKLNVVPSIFGNNLSDMSSFENNDSKENIKPGVSEIFESDETSFPLSAFTNHSGGAVGSDTQWDIIGKTFGMVNNKHYYFEGYNTPNGNTAIPINLKNEADEKLKAANETLGRRFPTSKEYVNNLLRRNWWQVKNSDAIFAISSITDNKVDGGTGWAAHMAIAENKPVYVFDQNKNKWFTWSNNKFVEVDTPVLTKNFAGIGTRNINEAGKQAIKEVYEKTIKSQVTLQQENTLPVNEVSEISESDETIFPYKIERASKENLDNSFIDMALAVQNHPISAEARMDPGGFDRLREASVNIQIAKMGYSHNEVLKMSSEQKQKLLGSTIMDVNNPMTNHYFTAQNINASGNIGIFANAKSFHSLATTLQKIRLVPKDRNNYAQHLASAAKLLGIEDFNLARMTFTDSNGVIRRISKEIAENIAAAVDAVKDPVHPLMGINKNNINVYVGLRLLGIDNYKIFYLINNAWDSLNIDYNDIKSSLKSYRPTLVNDFGTISKLFTNDVLSKMTDPKDFESTVKELVSKSNLKNTSYTDVIDQFIRAMMVINDFGNAVSQVILSTRYDSQNAAPSGSFSKMYSVIKKRNELFENGTDRFRLEISDDYYNNFSNTMYQYSYVEPMEILKTLFNTSAHELIFGLNPKISEKQSENILTDAYTDYITDSANNLYNIHREEFNKIFPNYFLEAIRETPYATKEFFRSIAKNMQGGLYLRTVKEMDTNLKDQFISEWELLYGDSRYKNLAVQLALYAIKVQGFGYNTRNFSFLIPSIIMEEVGDFQAINDNPEILYDYIILNAVRHIKPQRMDWMIKSGIIDIKESDNSNDVKLKLEAAVNSGKIKGIGKTIGRFFSTSDGLIFYVDLNNKVYTQKEMIETLEVSNYLKNTKYENPTLTEEFATVEDSKNLPNKDSYLKQYDVDYYNDYINDTDQESVDTNNLVSEESMLESMLYSNELFNEIKELENYRYIVESFEKELIAYKETTPEKYQHLVEDITIGLNPLSSNSNEQYLFTLPEVKDMSEEEVMKIVDDMRKCGVKI